MRGPAFWETSAIVPICIKQKGTGTAHQLLAAHPMVVWWATTVEMRSALARVARMGLLTAAEHMEARQRTEDLRKSWREIQPGEPLRNVAESLLDRFPLRAADALQLAAALTWCRNVPRERRFLSGDKQLLEAARSLRFEAVEV